MKILEILHITDLHYEAQGSQFQDSDKTALDPAFRANAFRNLDRMLSQGFRGRSFDAISVAGDITTYGKSSGFEKFDQGALVQLRKMVAVPEALCMVPGNHDVQWDLDIGAPDYFSKKFSSYQALVKKSAATSSLIPTGGIQSGDGKAIIFDPDVAGPIYVNKEQLLLVLCINSSMRCGERSPRLYSSLYEPTADLFSRVSKLTESVSPDDVNGPELDVIKRKLLALKPRLAQYSIVDVPHVTHAQLDEISGRLIDLRDNLADDWPFFTKVAIMHHHVVPFNYQVAEHKPFEITADASSVLETLASFKFHVLLTGHKHQPYVQDVHFRDAQFLAIGGMTVGGDPVPGFGQGIRHVALERKHGQIVVRIADLPCDFRGDVQARVAELINAAPGFSVYLDPPPRRFSFPRQIEQAVQDQLYSREFYRSNMIFTIDVKRRNADSLSFATCLSYRVTNRTDETRTWHTKYAFHSGIGAIQELRFDNREFDPMEPEFRDGRGLSLPSVLAPGQCGEVLIKAEETWGETGSTFCTSYFPATDLRVSLQADLPDIDFRFEVLYFWDVWPITRKGSREVLFDRGLLPYQGVRLHWRKL